MTHVPHQLHQEFPDQAKIIHRLQSENQHFARLCEDYDKINRDIHRAETNIQPVEELAEQEMRKKRMVLKDEIWHILKEAKTNA